MSLSYQCVAKGKSSSTKLEANDERKLFVNERRRYTQAEVVLNPENNTQREEDI